MPVGVNGKGLNMELSCSADGLVTFQRLPRQQSVCERIQGTHVPNGSAVGGCGDLGEQGSMGEVTRKEKDGQLAVSWEEIELQG